MRGCNIHKKSCMILPIFTDRTLRKCKGLNPRGDGSEWKDYNVGHNLTHCDECH